jgi:hypothetical protein
MFVLVCVCVYIYIYTSMMSSWLSQYATSWKVASSIPDEVTGLFS